MPRIELFTLGGFHATCDQQPLDGFRSDKVRALLIYLALAGDRPLLRRHLAELLWAGYEPHTALASLRVALNNLRTVLPLPDLVVTTPQTVQLRLEHPDFWCDALALDALLESPVLSPAAHQEAKRLHRAPFLQGFDQLDSPPFQQWLLARRQRYHQRLELDATSLHFPIAARSNNLPRLWTPFFGRDDDIDTICTLLLDPAYPLITVTGEGGIGKTRLALAVAEKLRSHFADGVWFVALAGFEPDDAGADRLAGAIASALQFTFVGVGPLTGQLCNRLKEKELLIVLDNFEQLIETSSFLVQLLQTSRQLKLLVTSRRRLDLQVEYVWRMKGLPVPPAPPVAASTASYESIQLFVERANRTSRGFRLDKSNQDDVVRICRLVEGLPLGVELAAALVEQYSCAEIASALQQNYSRLATPLLDLAPRHRSIHAMLHHSWSYLRPAQALALAKCSVFCGGFTAAAAIEVAHTSPELLVQLESHSLLRRTALGRYELHELVRQYAAAQLNSYPQQEQAAKNKHSAYYLKLLHTYQGRIRQDLAARQAVATEEENIRAAWNWATVHAHIEGLTQGVVALAEYLENAGYLHEGVTTYAATIRRIEAFVAASDQPSPDVARLLVLLRIPQAFFLTTQGRLDEAYRQVDSAVELAHQLGDSLLLARAYIRRGMVTETRGERISVFREAFERAFHYAQAGGWVEYVGQALSHLGWACRCQRDFEGARRSYEEALDLARTHGLRDLEATVLGNLGDLHQRAGRFSQAARCYEEALEVIQRFGKLEATGIMLYNLGALSELMGDWERGQLYLEQAYSLLHEIGYLFCEGLALTALGSLQQSRGLAEKALVLCEAALRIAATGQYESLQIRALLTLGQTLADLRRHDEAVVAYQQALTLARQRHHENWAYLARAGLAGLALAHGDLQAAQYEVEQLLPQLDALAQDAGNKPVALILTCWRVLSATGEARADELVQRGVRLVEAQAASIADEGRRRSFLEHVAANRQLMELAGPRMEKAASVRSTVTRNEAHPKP